jgi:uncharacterized protein YbjT (DUF2867 family)
MAEILAITCPSGHVGTHLIPLLYQQKRFQLRLAAHSPSSVKALRSAYPDADVRTVDTTSLEACRELLNGVTSVFHIGPSLHSREKEIGFNMVDAAVAEAKKPDSKFKHFVYSSVLCTQHRKLMQHDLKSFVEERLMLSPLNFTILQPTNFLAYPVAALAQQEKPVLERLWNPETPNSLVALSDLAEVGVKVLNEGEAHYLATYPLCSTLPMSDAEVAREIGKQIGKEVEVHSPPFEVGVESLLGYLFGRNPVALASLASADDPRPDISRDGAERLILFYNRYGLNGNPNVMRWLLGRGPTSVEQYVRAELARIR